MEPVTDYQRNCYWCRHWPGAEAGSFWRIERCRKGHGLTRGNATCGDWRRNLAKLPPADYEENLLQHGIVLPGGRNQKPTRGRK